MKSITKKGKECLFYTSSEEIPHVRYVLFNQDLVRVKQVGSGPYDLQERNTRARQYKKMGDYESMEKELSNQSLLLSYLFNGYSPEGIALAVICKSIGGVEKDDLTQDGLKRTLDELHKLGITKLEVDETLIDVKKKSKRNWKCFSLLVSKAKMWLSMQRS